MRQLLRALLRTLRYFVCNEGRRFRFVLLRSLINELSMINLANCFVNLLCFLLVVVG